jgi:hypothetical protein
MIKTKYYFSTICLLIGLVVISGLTACTPEVPEVEAPITETEIETVVPEPTAIQETPVVEDMTPSVLLVSDGEVASFIYSQTLTSLESLTTDSAKRMVVLDMLAPEMITPDVQVVVGVGANLNLNRLAVNWPGVAFLVIGDPTATVANNVSVIGDPGTEIRQKAFMAGYLSALISSDNKIAALIHSDNPEHDLLGESFVVGGRFYCGLCQPLYPPYNVFPQWEAVISEPGGGGYRPLVNSLASNGVEIVYVHGELVSPDLLSILEELGMKVVSDQPPDIVRGNWVGTLTIDPVPALENLWPDLVAGGPGVSISAAITLTDAEMGLVSEGRYRLFEEMAADLQAGLVSIGIVP